MAGQPKHLEEVEGRPSELSLLFEISQALDSSLDLRNVVEPVLEAITRSLGMKFATLTLLNRQTGEIAIEAAHGLSAAQRLQGKYRLGEGITGKVIATGKASIVPKISEEAHFLNRTRARQTDNGEDLSFVCVPIKLGREVVGALSADRPVASLSYLQEEARILSIIASLIAQAVRLRRSAQEERERLVEENLRLQDELKDGFRPPNIIGNSKAMQSVYELIAQVSTSNTSVLLRGETGVGKELVAHAIHHASRRATKPFIKVNCAALPIGVIESELFGHEKGAFTGAVESRKGRFELAQGGTLFLDEIGDFSPAMQIKLLRVLQEREFERVGGTATLKTDVRLIAATNRNLEKLIENGQFREDLYYRLNVFPVHVPPLRKRGTDILLLADHFVERYSKQNNRKVARISTTASNMLTAYDWPGNVRELENCIERAVLLTDEEAIHGHHLPPSLRTAESRWTDPRETLATALEAVEKELIIEALKSSYGKIAPAAASLGITERIMGLRLRRYRIEPKMFRSPLEKTKHGNDQR
jgi:Nif-specific regulatory protein